MPAKQVSKPKSKAAKSIRKLPSKHSKPGKEISVDLKAERNEYLFAIEKIKRQFKDKPHTPIPRDLIPMLATLTKSPFNNADWLFEIKWDGYRSIAYLSEGEVKLRSRSNISYNEIYTPVYEALKQWKVNAVIDGEIVVLNQNGKSDFEALQNWQRRNSGSLAYYVFDILWLDGIDLTEVPLEKRKEILKNVLPGNGIIKFSDSIDEYGIDLFKVAKENELEGIVGKRKDSLYYPGKRTNDWLKMPIEVHKEFVIGGWTESDSNRAFKSLLFGYYENGELMYVGHAGGGFKENEMNGILSRLKEIEISKSPFTNEVEKGNKIHWVKPQLVAEIKYASKTSAGKIRKPAIFLGFRNDKLPVEVIKETVASVEKKQHAIKHTNIKVAEKKEEGSNWPVIESQKITSSSDYKFENGREVHLFNIERKLWGDFTKAHLLMYYHRVFPFMEPHLKDRPLSIHIKNNGPTAPGLYIKDMEGHQPSWAETFSIERKHKKKGKRNIIDYLLCNDEATLQYVINLGAIDINPWTSRTSSPQSPDYIIIDLDPSDDDFKKVIETARAAKSVFDKNKLISFPKTSGKTGMHLYLPCQDLNFTEARTIAENICFGIHEKLPSITTTDVSINNRGNKLYIDPNQNDFADTVAAPYSVRPFHQPIVSTPLEWKEINDRLDPLAFDLATVLTRLDRKGDLFYGSLMEKNRIVNMRALKKFL